MSIKEQVLQELDILNAWCEITCPHQSTKSVKASQGRPSGACSQIQQFWSAILAASRARNPLRS